MKWIVTGGAGFVGCNTVKRLLAQGDEVVLIDNLSRKGTQANLEWLRTYGKFEFVCQDIRDYDSVCALFKCHQDVDVVLHLAAQVAVTTSVVNPREDFEINAIGTFNLLEAVRNFAAQAVFLYASTNKVYGKMEQAGIKLVGDRYQYSQLPKGVDETASLDFYSPYGCSKGAADQYVRDYSRIYGLRTVVFRQSCIAGIRQLGIEDQGWVAWFTIAAVLGSPITIYGDGKQVRDVLFVDDLVSCYLQAVKQIDTVSGQVYNIGGGTNNQLSLLELLQFLQGKFSDPLKLNYSGWRPGDQRIFVADVSKAKLDFDWEPKLDILTGLNLLYTWVCQEQPLLQSVLADQLNKAKR